METIRSLEIEEAFLGALVDNPVAIRALASELTAEQFEDERHARIFETLVELARRAKTLDTASVARALEERGLLDSVGGSETLGRLIEPRAALESARATLACRLHEECLEPREATPALGPMGEVFRTLTRVQSSTPMGLRTGYSGLDTLTRGLRPGELTLVGGAHAQGKTSFAFNLATRLALAKDRPAVLVVTPHCDSVATARRLAGLVARVPGRRIVEGTVSREEEERLINAGEHLTASRLFLEGAVALATEELVAMARAARQGGNLDVLILDHLEALDGAENGPRGQRRAVVGRAIGELSELARELAIPVMATTDLGHVPEKRERHTPQLNDLSARAAAVRHPGVVLLLFRPGYYMARHTAEAQDLASTLVATVAHNRVGPTGDVELFLDCATGAIYEPVR